MSARHTPGPWKVCEGSPFTRWYVKAIHATYVIAECGISEGKTGEANARLIAAAPDLLALARQYASECGDCAGTRVCPDDEPCTECADIWRIIDKAEGRV
ncbi:MAG: hypothetical protein U1F09_12995 [Steroidobacteraceae bacterium]